MNSSVADVGPRVANSLMTTWFAAAPAGGADAANRMGKAIPIAKMRSSRIGGSARSGGYRRKAEDYHGETANAREENQGKAPRARPRDLGPRRRSLPAPFSV